MQSFFLLSNGMQNENMVLYCLESSEIELASIEMDYTKLN